MSSSSTYILNWGPHHPSTHGVLRLILELDGEKVVSCTPDVGYLHRDIEKIVEKKKFLQIIPFIDRLDYLAPSIQEHAYVMAIEKVLNIDVPIRSQYIRVIVDELTRISSHIMAIGSSTHDLGNISVLVYGFEEREKIMDIFEDITGARMHLNYYVPGGVWRDIEEKTLLKIKSFIKNIKDYINTIETLVFNSNIFILRTKDIGIITKDIAIQNGISGINIRASGINSDVRTTGYSVYNNICFQSITLNEGDCYSRIRLRYLEIQQSIQLIERCLDQIRPGPINEFIPISDSLKRGSIEKMLYAAFFSRGIELPENTRIYASAETPRGEFGIHLVTQKDKTKPYRLHFKSPSFAHIQMLGKILNGCTIPEINAILGSLDFIIGCCDR
ncbi:MAG: NADH-quinone oxidoreductase subunit D [Alphaproteobacteria bacterium]|nr:NADH-quinone oxidoreductase subunit D [Alphaproteobacteria bacterium]